MATIKIEGIDGLDGSYEFDPSFFTNRELHIIKQETGLRAGELGDAVEQGDNDLVVTLAYIALRRLGKPQAVMDALWDAKTGGITLMLGDEDSDDSPPEQVPPSESDDGGTSDGGKQTSGDDS